MMDDETRVRFEYVDRDLRELKTAVTRVDTVMQGLKPPRNWPSLLTVFAIVIPLYALVGDLIARGFH